MIKILQYQYRHYLVDLNLKGVYGAMCDTKSESDGLVLVSVFVSGNNLNIGQALAPNFILQKLNLPGEHETKHSALKTWR